MVMRFLYICMVLMAVSSLAQAQNAQGTGGTAPAVSVGGQQAPAAPVQLTEQAEAEILRTLDNAINRTGAALGNLVEGASDLLRRSIVGATPLERAQALLRINQEILNGTHPIGQGIQASKTALENTAQGGGLSNEARTRARTDFERYEELLRRMESFLTAQITYLESSPRYVENLLSVCNARLSPEYLNELFMYAQGRRASLNPPATPLDHQLFRVNSVMINSIVTMRVACRELTEENARNLEYIRIWQTQGPGTALPSVRDSLCSAAQNFQGYPSRERCIENFNEDGSRRGSQPMRGGVRIDQRPLSPENNDRLRNPYVRPGQPAPAPQQQPQQGGPQRPRVPTNLEQRSDVIQQELDSVTGV